MGSPRHPAWHTTGEHRLCRSLFVTSYSSKAPLPNLLQPLAASPIHPLLSRRAVQNAKPPTRPCLLCRQCHRDPKQQGAAKQHHGAKPKKAFLLLPTMLSPTATQGWASAMLSDESKQWGRAGRRNFWPMPICPLCTHPAPMSCIPPGWRQPLAQPQCSAWWKEPPWTPSPAKLYLHLATA